MKAAVTSRDAILQACRDLAARQGLPALSMRTVAAECGIAPGTLYNYFPDKDALLLAAVQSIWQDIFHSEICREELPFPDYLEALFDGLRRGAARYPGFLADHAAVLARCREDGEAVRERSFGHIRRELLAALQADPRLQPGVFSGGLTPEGLAGLATDQLCLMLAQGKEDCTALTALIRRALYR